MSLNFKIQYSSFGTVRVFVEIRVIIFEKRSSILNLKVITDHANFEGVQLVI